ncbi:MAG TPA: glycosyltransferase, partial [Planctomycetota bacterium]|nr:glycosyltransferase [Planctomycetota bacterium]
TGSGELARWVAARFPSARSVANAANLGFARALRAGIEAARHGLVLAMNPDILVREGFLEPLVAALGDPEVHSAVPRILLFGDPERVESIVEIAFERDLAYVRQRGLEGQARRFSGVLPVNYAIGGALLVRRDEFLAGGGFDPLYEPFYYEDVDLGFAAWRAGRRVLWVGDSVVEHHHRGTIRRRVDEGLVRAVIERNRLLFQWKFVEGEEAVERELEALYRLAIDAYLRDEREELVWLALALDRLQELEASRRALPRAARSFAAVIEESSPLGDGPA